ncbi:MAG TPA: class I SAM-dependent methyltransferase [Candidatus Binatus sp.]|jgi:SAM-dependent methyltransferase|nr:class I SAM-dependent methyltransferase [Candidatus Binatus sp.]
MNRAHLEFLASPWWANYLETELLPWVLGATDLGDDVLEVGPGPGLTTDVLRRQVAALTAVEVDGDLAAALANRLAGTNVEVVHADATDSGLATDRFSAATCFTMLHHVPSPELQDRLFAEVCRVLRPGGILIGTDSIDSDAVRQGHVDDVFVPVDPATLGLRLEAAGFVDVSVERASDAWGERVRFHACKPVPAGSS